jgi:uncharacterized protein
MSSMSHAASHTLWRPTILLVMALSLHFSETFPLQAEESNSLDARLFTAIDNNDIVAVERLLRDGANVEARGANGITPLMNAAEYGRVPMVSLLLDNGAKAEEKDEQGESPLSIAARNGHVRIVNLLAQLSDTKTKNRALFAAMEGGPVGVIEVTDTPVQPNRLENQREETQPPEFEVSWTVTVATLLDDGADIEARNEDGSTPLDWAAAFAKTDVVKLLIQRGAKTNVTDKNGNTPLISAACGCAVATMNSAYDVVKILLDQGAKVNARNKDGQTALIMASGMTGDASVLKLLLNNGADPGLKDHKGMTALSLAKQNRREDKIAILKTMAVH